MKRIISLLLVVVLACTFVGCSSDELGYSIDGYEYADFDRFNSYASVNGLDGTYIYVNGIVKSVHDFEGYCNITIESEDGGCWVANPSGVAFSENIKDLLEDKNVVCYGQYHGFSNVYSMPVVLIDKIELDDEEYSLGYLYNLSENELTEEVTSSMIEPQASENSTDKYSKIYSDSNIEVYFSGTESRASGNYIQFWIENKTEHMYSFLGETVTINGVCYNNITCVGEISAHSKGKIDCNVSGWELADVTKLGLHMVYYIETESIGDMNVIDIVVNDVTIKN